MKLGTGFSSWDKMKNLDENQVLDKSKVNQQKTLTLPQPTNPEQFEQIFVSAFRAFQIC